MLSWHLQKDFETKNNNFNTIIYNSKQALTREGEKTEDHTNFYLTLFQISDKRLII
jgi:hypothetical protein